MIDPESDPSDPSAFRWSHEGIRPPEAEEKRVPAAANENPAPAPTGPEQRRFPRIDLKLPVLYKIMADEPVLASTALNPCFPTRSGNVSVQGACLVLAERLPGGTILALSIHLAENHDKLSAVARVVWAEGADVPHHFLTGIEFIVVYRKHASKTEYMDPSVLQKLFHIP